MNYNDFAKLLMSEERRSWQDPEQVLDTISIKPGSTVVDLACGPGFFTIPIARKITTIGTVYAVDSNPTMIDHLQRNLAAAGLHDEVTVIEADVSKTKIPDEVADYILFANVLHDIEDKKSFLREVSRLAGANCSIVDIDWHKRESEMGPPMNLRLSEQESRQLLRDSGFSIVRPINAGKYHYGFVCKKQSNRAI